MGGLGGHMAHLSEDLELTFNELVSILSNVALANIEAVTEKVDGQNLFLSVDQTGQIRAARNAGDVKKGGMTPEEYASKWAGHPAENAFTNGFAAISAALRRLSPQDLSDIFADGDRYVNMEIMYPGNPNIILYSAPHIVLHGLKYFGPLALKSRDELTDEEKEELRNLATASAEKFPYLVRAVDGGQEEVSEELWTVNGPKVVALNKLADGTVLDEVTEIIQTVAAPVGMDAKLKDYVELKVRQYAEQVNMPEDRIDDLLLLMLDRDEAKSQGITVNSVKKGLPPDLRSVVSDLGATTKSKKYISSVLKPLELAISDFAIEVLRGLKSYFVDEHDEVVRGMRDELQRSIVHLKALQASGDENMGELVDKQLAKLGNIENLASSMEGIVFEYPVGSGRIYKLTGAFAMANQIIGRARRSGMTESVTREFTVRVSQDRKITKTIEEWMREINASNHVYQKPPDFVYRDILNGVPIIEIVQKENAQTMIYNTILTHTAKIYLEQEETIELDIVADDEVEAMEDEAGDPVVDNSAASQTIALVPGAFKPPHRGHADMVRAYATGDGVPKADRTIILISNPQGAKRILPHDNSEVNAEHSKEIWEKVFSDVTNLPGVDIQIASSEMRSPVSIAYEYISQNTPLDLRAGDSVILGASRKDRDYDRWKGAQGRPANKEGVSVLAGEEYSVTPSERSDGKNFSATDLRQLISNLVVNPQDMESLQQLTEYIPQNKVKELYSVLGQPSPVGREDLDELSSGSGGSVAGFAGSIGTIGRILDDSEDEKKDTVDEVIRLFMERGILR